MHELVTITSLLHIGLHATRSFVCLFASLLCYAALCIENVKRYNETRVCELRICEKALKKYFVDIPAKSEGEFLFAAIVSLTLTIFEVLLLRMERF